MSEFRHLRLETDESNIVWLTLDVQHEANNILGPEVLDELSCACTALLTSKPAGVVVCSAKPTSFIAGVDIKLMTQVETTEQALAFIHKGQNVCLQFADLPFPTLALIDGLCLGGGLELALALDYRIASNNAATRLSLPEVKLGIHPGFGGTVRSIAKIGAPNAMEIMLTGRQLQPEEALKMGLIDRLAPKQELRDIAIQMLRKLPAKAKPAMHVAALSKLAPSRKLLGVKLRQQVAEHAPQEHYPAPYALIELWEKHGGSPAEMYKAEAISVAKLVMGEIAQNLIRVFFLQNRLKSLGDKQLFQPQHVLVISDSEVGHEIHAWCARQGLHTEIRETITPNDDSIVQANIIIEATASNLQTKQKLLAELETRVRPETILATNTACTPLEDIAGTMREPKRLVGLHFLTPVSKIPLVEVIHDPHDMDESVVMRTQAFVRHINKLPLPVKSSPDFLVNRILIAYVMEGIRLQQQGIPTAILDAAARDFGMPLGPLEMADTMGLDVCQQMGELLAKKLGQQDIPLAIYHMTRAGKLGRKSGEGFYRYRNGKIMKEEKIEWQGNRITLQTKLIEPMVREARACLAQGIVDDADLLDAGIIFGAGFAPFRGGLLHYAQNKPS